MALDIGSTVVKIARLDGQGGLVSQEFFPRDYELGVAKQVVPADRLGDDAYGLVCPALADRRRCQTKRWVIVPTHTSDDRRRREFNLWVGAGIG